MAGTVAGLATLWTLVEIVLFVEPFSLVWLPEIMRWTGGALLLMALFLFGLTWWSRRQPELGHIVNTIEGIPHPSIVRWAALAGGGVLLFIGYVKDEISVKDVAQKQLAERGIDFTFEAFQNVLYLLNFGGIELFLKAGVEPERVFVALGRSSDLSDRQPLVYAVTRRIDSGQEAWQLVELLHDPQRDGQYGGDLNQIIEADGVRATLLNFAMNQSAAELALELLKRGASPFEHAATAAGRADPYLVDPYLPLLSQKPPPRGRADIAAALERNGVRPSRFVAAKFGEELEDLRNEDSATMLSVSSVPGDLDWLHQARLWWSGGGAPAEPMLQPCEIGADGMIAEGCPWAARLAPRYRGVAVTLGADATCEVEPFELMLDHLWAYPGVARGAAGERRAADRQLALLEGAITRGEGPDSAPVFLQVTPDRRLTLFQQLPDQSFSQHQGRPSEDFDAISLAGPASELRMLRAAGAGDGKLPKRRHDIALGRRPEVSAITLPGYVDGAVYQLTYRLSLGDWRRLDAEIEPRAGGDLCVTFRRAGDDASASAGAGVLARSDGRPLTLTNPALSPGDYELIVQAAGDAEPYRVSLLPGEVGLMGTASLDGAPPPAQGWPSRLVDKGEIAAGGEIFYRVTSDTWNKVSIALTGLAADVDLSLHRADGAGLPSGDPLATSAEGQTASERIENATLTPATYVMRLQSFGEPLPYTLTINAETIESQEIRGGDAIADAELLGELDRAVKLAAYVGPGHPRAVFGFDLTQASRVRITLDELTADLDLELFAEDGSSIDASADAEKAPEQLDRPLRAGRHFVEVRSYTADPSTYQLSLAATPLDPATEAMLDEAGPGPDDTAAGAREVGDPGEAPVHVEGALGDQDSSDFVRFELAQPGTVVAELRGLARDVDLVLHDAATMVELAGSYNLDTQEETIELALPAGGYLLDVQRVGSGFTPYTLDLAAR